MQVILWINLLMYLEILNQNIFFVSNKTKEVAEAANSKLNNAVKIINVDELQLPSDYKINKKNFQMTQMKM